MAGAAIPVAGLFDDDARDVRLAKARDSRVWAAWYDRHYEALYRYAYAHLHDREEAEDVAAQVFLKALRGIDSYRYSGKPILAWFYGIARNLVVDRARVRSRRAVGPQAEELPTPGPEAQLATLDLRRAISKLRPEQREVVVLHFVLGYSIREVAALMGKREAAVYSMQSRAIAGLRATLSN